jgi:hypothetical protein
MTVDEMALDRMIADEMALNQVTADEINIDRITCFLHFNCPSIINY